MQRAYKIIRNNNLLSVVIDIDNEQKTFAKQLCNNYVVFLQYTLVNIIILKICFYI